MSDLALYMLGQLLLVTVIAAPLILLVSVASAWLVTKDPRKVRSAIRQFFQLKP